MVKRIGWLWAGLISASSAMYAQDADSLLRIQQDSSFLSSIDSDFSSYDSLEIFLLIDSMMQVDMEVRSQFVTRLSYNSNVLYTGRTLGIDQFGLSPGISYYHKSGFYGDVSGYWSNDFEPNYYLTTVSAGYMTTFAKWFSVIASYDHYFYNLGDEFLPYTDAVSVTPYFEFGPVVFTPSYSFYFGEGNAHRIMPGLGFNLEKRNFLGFKRISLTPTFYTLVGNETITEIRFPENARELLRRLRQNLPWFEVIEKNVFGVMNYSFSLPLAVYTKKWGFFLSYNYSIPKALEGETIELENTGFIAGSISYYINTKRP